MAEKWFINYNLFIAYILTAPNLLCFLGLFWLFVFTLYIFEWMYANACLLRLPTSQLNFILMLVIIEAWEYRPVYNMIQQAIYVNMITLHFCYLSCFFAIILACILCKLFQTMQYTMQRNNYNLFTGWYILTSPSLNVLRSGFSAFFMFALLHLWMDVWHNIILNTIHMYSVTNAKLSVTNVFQSFF